MHTPTDRSARIQRLLELRDRDPRTHTFAELADLYREKGDLETALEVVEGGLRHHPHFLNARLVRARLLVQLGRPDEAVSAFEQVLQIDSENSETLEALTELREGDSHTTATERPSVTSSVQPAVGDWLARLDADWRGDAGRSNGGVDGEATGLDGGSVNDDASTQPSTDEGRAQEGDVSEPENQPGKSEAPAGEPEAAVRPSGSDDLETATLARLYANQGLTEEAIGIYERLLARDPYNARLAADLEEARRKGQDRKQGVSTRSREVRAQVPRPDVPFGSDRPTAPEGADEDRDADPQGHDEDSAELDAGDPQPDDGSTVREDVSLEPPIRDYLESLLEGQAPSLPTSGESITWPDWLTNLGTTDDD